MAEQSKRASEIELAERFAGADALELAEAHRSHVDADERAEKLFRIFAEAKAAHALLPSVQWPGLSPDEQAAWRALARKVTGVHDE